MSDKAEENYSSSRNANSLKWIPTWCKTIAILRRGGGERREHHHRLFSTFTSALASISTCAPPSFIFTLNHGIASSLSQLIHRGRIFRVNFLTAPSDIPRASIYIFVGPFTSPSSNLVFFVLPLYVKPRSNLTRDWSKKTDAVNLLSLQHALCCY